MLEKLTFPNAEITLQGAHLTQFKDWLYLSSASLFEPGKAIRGGVPVVFPYFGPSKHDPNAPQHGFARTSVWKVESQNEQSVSLELSEQQWRIQLRFEFGDTLTTRVQVQNQALNARSFEFALHTYFTVSDIAHVEIEGLDGRTYIDKPDGGARKSQSGLIRFDGEVDRVYLNAPSPLFIRDGASGYELRGDWKSAVTWNPAEAKAATMKDLGEGEWKRFVCLEVGAIADDAIELEPGATWTMNQEVARL